MAWQKEGEKWEFSLVDSGRGIDPSYHEQVFKSSNSPSSLDTKSHGVGLAIVKKIVEMHGGEIHLTSEIGKGANFTFTLACA